MAVTLNLRRTAPPNKTKISPSHVENDLNNIYMTCRAGKIKPHGSGTQTPHPIDNRNHDKDA